MCINENKALIKRRQKYQINPSINKINVLAHNSKTFTTAIGKDVIGHIEVFKIPLLRFEI